MAGAPSSFRDTGAAVGTPEEALAAALRGVNGSRAYWDAFPPGVRKQILEWINTARRPETRAKRVAETARLAGENIRANQWRPRS